MFEELDKDREAYEKLSLEELIQNYNVTDAIVDRFEEYVNLRTRYKITFAAYREEVKLYLKAALGEQLFNTDAYFKIVNSRDNMVEEVLKLSNKD